MKKKILVGSAILAVIGSVIQLSAESHSKEKLSIEIPSDHRGAVVLRDEQGKVVSVITPASNPTAQAAQDKGRGKSQSQPSAPPPPPPCSFPKNLVVHDVENAQDTIESQNGFFLLKSYGPLIGEPYGIFGLYFLGYSQALGMTGYWDWNSDSRNLPLMISAIAALAGSGDLIIRTGEALTLIYDGGRSLTATFPVDVVIPRDNAVSFFVSDQGRLFWDAGLTLPLDSGPLCL